MSDDTKVSAPGTPSDDDHRDREQAEPETLLGEGAGANLEGVALRTLSSDIAEFAMGPLAVNQTGLADRIGVTQGYISRVLKGLRNFTIVHLEKLARELDMPVAALIWKASTLPEPDDQEEGEVVQELDRLMALAYPEHFPADAEHSAPRPPMTKPEARPTSAEEAGRPECGKGQSNVSE